MTAWFADHFAITHSRRGSAAIIELHGELDLAVTAQLASEFDRLVASDPAVVLVDLRGLSFMDACGLRALIGLRTSCEQQGRRLLLVRGQRAVHRVLALCDVERTFEFVDAAADAPELAIATGGPRAPAPRCRATMLSSHDVDAGLVTASAQP